MTKQLKYLLFSTFLLSRSFCVFGSVSEYALEDGSETYSLAGSSSELAQIVATRIPQPDNRAIQTAFISPNLSSGQSQLGVHFEIFFNLKVLWLQIFPFFLKQDMFQFIPAFVNLCEGDKQEIFVGMYINLLGHLYHKAPLHRIDRVLTIPQKPLLSITFPYVFHPYILVDFKEEHNFPKEKIKEHLKVFFEQEGYNDLKILLLNGYVLSWKDYDQTPSKPYYSEEEKIETLQRVLPRITAENVREWATSIIRVSIPITNVREFSTFEYNYRHHSSHDYLMSNDLRAFLVEHVDRLKPLVSSNLRRGISEKIDRMLNTGAEYYWYWLRNQGWAGEDYDEVCFLDAINEFKDFLRLYDFLVDNPGLNKAIDERYALFQTVLYAAPYTIEYDIENAIIKKQDRQSEQERRIQKLINRIENEQDPDLQIFGAFQLLVNLFPFQHTSALNLEKIMTCAKKILSSVSPILRKEFLLSVLQTSIDSMEEDNVFEFKIEVLNLFYKIFSVEDEPIGKEFCKTIMQQGKSASPFEQVKVANFLAQISSKDYHEAIQFLLSFAQNPKYRSDDRKVALSFLEERTSGEYSHLIAELYKILDPDFYSDDESDMDENVDMNDTKNLDEASSEWPYEINSFLWSVYSNPEITWDQMRELENLSRISPGKYLNIAIDLFSEIAQQPEFKRYENGSSAIQIFSTLFLEHLDKISPDRLSMIVKSLFLFMQTRAINGSHAIGSYDRVIAARTLAHISPEYLEQAMNILFEITRETGCYDELKIKIARSIVQISPRHFDRVIAELLPLISSEPNHQTAIELLNFIKKTN